MTKSLLSVLALTLSICAISLFSPSVTFAQTKSHTASKAAAADSYLVIEVTDDNKADNKVEYKVIPTSQLKDEKKRIETDYKQKVKEWQDLKKGGSDAPHPVKPILKKIGTPYQTQTGAQKIADKLKDDAANKDTGDQKPKDNKQ